MVSILSKLSTKFFHRIGVLPFRQSLLSRLWVLGQGVRLWGTRVKGQERKEMTSRTKCGICRLTGVQCPATHDLTGNLLPHMLAGSQVHRLWEDWWCSRASQGFLLDQHSQTSNWSLLFINRSCFVVQKGELIKILQMVHLEKCHSLAQLHFHILSMFARCAYETLLKIIRYSHQPLGAGCVWVCSEDPAETVLNHISMQLSVLHITYISVVIG